MGVYRSSEVIQDINTFRFRDASDVDLSNYVDFDVDDGGTVATIKIKIGDLLIKDVDDASNTDTFQITADPAGGGIKQKTSKITNGAIWEIEPSGTYDGSSATVDLDFLLFDIDGMTINDGTAFAVSLRGIYQDWDGITMTAVTLSNITGIAILLPSSGKLNSERGILINADKSVVSNNAIALETSRDISGTLAAAESFTNYANIFGQAVAHSGGDFILTHDEGVMKLVMAHTTTVACTSPDVFSGTALLIDIDADVNVGTSDAKVDCSARAIDITYTLAETDGVMRMAATDIFRITPTIPTGLSSAGAFQFDVMELNLDNVIANDANLTLNSIYIDASGLTNTSSAEINLINLVAPDDSNIDNLIKLVADVGDSALSQQLINTSRDLNAAITADRAITNFGTTLSQVINNTSAGDFDVSDAGASGVAKIEMSHTVATTVGAKTDPDVMQGTALLIDIDAVTNDANAKLDAYPRALDIAYTLTETLGTLRWATTDIARIDFNTSAALTSAAAAAINMLLLDATGVTINDSNVSLDALKIDMSTLTLTDASSLHGIEVTIPTLVGQATTRYAGYFNDGTVTAKVVDGSMAITGTGLNDEKYYKCEDFDEEAAAVTLAAGLRADEWVRGGVNDADANSTYIQDQGGVLQIVTAGADDDSHEITWLGTTVNIGSNPILEFRVMIDAVTASLSGFFVGVTETRDIQTINDISAVSDDYFVVGMNSDLATPADLRVWSEDNNGGQVLTQLTGVAIAANTWCTIRIDLTDTEQPRVWINATGGAITPSNEIAAATIASHTVQNNIYVMPVIFVQCLDATPSARTLKIDYVKIWQDRS